MSDSITIKVSTKGMLQVASEMESKIKASKDSFDTLDNLAKKVVGYWEGEGADMHVKTYKEKLDVASSKLQPFFDSVNNLRTVTGVYENADSDVKKTVEALETDVIS